MADTKTVYHTDKDGEHSYQNKENDFKEYYNDNEKDFSFREELIRNLFEKAIANRDMLNDLSEDQIEVIANKSILAGDVLLKKLYASLSEKNK